MAKKTDERIEQLIVSLYKQGRSAKWMIKNIEELKSKHPGTIYGILNRNGFSSRKLSLETRSGMRKYSVNDYAFKSIDTEEKAYWLGFLYADGYITGESVGLSLSDKDKEHLEKFKSFLESTHPINTYVEKSGYAEGSNYVRLLFQSHIMVNDLEKNGMFRNKTLILQYPEFLRDDLHKHFIRGYIDGDGSWSYDSHTKGYQCKICGTKELLEGILSHIGYSHMKLFQRHPERNVNNYYISIGGNYQVIDIMKFVYMDCSVYLDRKYRRYVDLQKLLMERSSQLETD